MKTYSMISKGQKYFLNPYISDGELPLVWKVLRMDKCNRCDAEGPVYVDRHHGDYRATCCNLQLGVDE